MAEGKEKKGFFKRLVEGLSKTRENIVSGIDSIFSGYSSIDDLQKFNSDEFVNALFNMENNTQEN